MKNLFTTLCFLLTLNVVLIEANAQQDPHYTLYKYNMGVINPAAAGTTNGVEGLLAVRSQWSGIKGGPETQSFNINSPFGERIGLGLNIVNDQVFVLRESSFQADFSYRLSISRYSNIFLGIKAGGSFLNVDLNELGITNDALFSQNVSRFNPNVGVGVYMKGEKFFVSLSAPGLLKNTRYEKEGLQPVEASDRLHMYLGGGYNFYLSDTWDLMPSTMVKAVFGAPTSIDLSATATYANKIEFGTNYRLDESISGLFTIRIENWGQFGYAYEHTLTDINTYSQGSHEVLFKFFINYRTDLVRPATN